MIATTNQEKPFEVGEVIDFCGDRFTVVKNFGTQGIVSDGYDEIEFYWEFHGDKCHRVIGVK